MEIKYYKYCLRCGRRLKSEDARIRGYGKVCFEKARQKACKKPLFTAKAN